MLDGETLMADEVEPLFHVNDVAPLPFKVVFAPEQMLTRFGVIAKAGGWQVAV